MEKKTPLYDCHTALSGKLVPFAGYLLPVQYAGVIEEHMAVRQRAGIFDVSHMSEIVLSGPAALENLNYLLTNDFTSLAEGGVRYSPMCNENGGIVDDMVVYHLSGSRYMIVANAANREKDVDFIRRHLSGDVKMDDMSDSFAQIALQGPASRDILAKLTSEHDIPGKYYTFTEKARVSGVECILSQTGYTGEHGYELYCANENAVSLWHALMYAGAEYGLAPCGLGARDTLRLEAGMPLYGHEMSDEISPVEAGLSFAVKMKKPDFIGKAALENRGVPNLTRVGLKLSDRGIARENCAVFADDRQVGQTTSGTHFPFLGGAYAMALIEKEYAPVGTPIGIDVRGRRLAAEVVALPFYKK